MTEPYYYSKEQADTLHRLRDAAGGSAFDVAWTHLIADIRADMQAGGGPQTEQAKALARRWKGLIQTFTNGDSEIERMLYEAGDKFYANAPLQDESLPDVLGYIRKIFDASGGVGPCPHFNRSESLPTMAWPLDEAGADRSGSQIR